MEGRGSGRREELVRVDWAWDELGDRRGEESFVKSAKLSSRTDEVVGAIGKLKYQDK